METGQQKYANTDPVETLPENIFSTVISTDRLQTEKFGSTEGENV